MAHGEAIAQYLAREEALERVRADALAAWGEYEATGWHATGEDVDAWLARWKRAGTLNRRRREKAGLGAAGAR